MGVPIVGGLWDDLYGVAGLDWRPRFVAAGVRPCREDCEGAHAKGHDAPVILGGYAAMQIVVQIGEDLARIPRHAWPQHPDLREMLAVEAEYGVVLRPMHLGTNDPVLNSYFVIEAPEFEESQRLAERLRRCRAVTAAYVKPPDAMP